MQVHRAAASVPCITGIADDITHLDAIACAEGPIAIQVRVVVPLETGPEDPHYLAAEIIGADARHEAARGTYHWRILRREYVDALMATSA